MSKLSPMMEQYKNIKQNHQDHILFFRLGDFYEMFFDDATLCSKELELALTGRDCGSTTKAPMCGVPHHSCESYIARLVKKGYKVAICEQTTLPGESKGIVEREVVRVITPGTVIENSILEDEKNNYIASVFFMKSQVALTFSDISTGEVTIIKSDESQYINQLSRFAPSEVLIDENLATNKILVEYVKNKLNASITTSDFNSASNEEMAEVIEKQFNKSLEELGLEKDNVLVKSLWAFLKYLQITQQKGLERISVINFSDGEQFMQIGNTARVNLELLETIQNREKKGSLLWVLDKTSTPMGKRLLRKYIEQPLINPVHIEKRLNTVEELVNNFPLRSEIIEDLAPIQDIERLLTRVVYGSTTPRELITLGFIFNNIPNLKNTLSKGKTKLLTETYEKIDSLDDVGKYIFSAIQEDPPATIKDGNFIQAGFNAEVDRLRDIITNGKAMLHAQSEKLKEDTGIKNLKISYNKIFGYYIEVTKSYLDLVPDYFIRRQTLANCERYITDELKELESEILNANDKILVAEKQLFEEVRVNVAKELERIQSTANYIAVLDVITSFAQISFTNNYVKPVVNSSDRIDIKDGRHPVVEKLVSDFFVPNNSVLDRNNQMISIITGPNMAGKSTYMRQIALITIMAQIGCFVPASYAEIGIVDKVFTRVGASDDLASGKSTFMVEMSEVADILKFATKKSLLILDELGRGTSTFDGMSIAKSVIEYIGKKIKCKTVFATHYHELVAMEDQMDCIKNYNIAVKKKDDSIVFLRKIVAGGTDDSYGIDVANLAGVPKDVVKRAKEILVELENGSGNLVQTPKLIAENTEISFSSFNENEIIEEIRNIDINTLTPIEAMNILYKVHKKIEGWFYE